MWFWVIIVMVVLAIAGSQMGGGNSGSQSSSSSSTGAQSSTSSSSSQQQESESKVELQATATGSGSVTWGETGSSSQQSFNQAWSKTITGDDAKKGYSMIVTGDFTGGDNQKVSCTVLVNGKQKSHKEATGSGASVSCDTSGLFN